MGLAIPPGTGIRAVRVEGQPAVSPERLSGPDGVNLRIFGAAGDPVKLEIDFDPAKPATVVIFERSALPETPEARELVASRPLDANQVHGGDDALVFRKLDLKAVTPVPDPRAP